MARVPALHAGCHWFESSTAQILYQRLTAIFRSQPSFTTSILCHKLITDSPIKSQFMKKSQYYYTSQFNQNTLWICHCVLTYSPERLFRIIVLLTRGNNKGGHEDRLEFSYLRYFYLTEPVGIILLFITGASQFGQPSGASGGRGGQTGS